VNIVNKTPNLSRAPTDNCSISSDYHNYPCSPGAPNSSAQALGDKPGPPIDLQTPWSARKTGDRPKPRQSHQEPRSGDLVRRNLIRKYCVIRQTILVRIKPEQPETNPRRAPQETRLSPEKLRSYTAFGMHPLHQSLTALSDFRRRSGKDIRSQRVGRIEWA